LFEGLDHLKQHALLSEQSPKALMADVVDHPLSDQELSELAERPGRERETMILRTRQGDLLDLLTLGQRELRRTTTGVLRCQRVEPVSVEVVDHLPDTVLGGERDPGDRRDVHRLGGPQHDLRPPPADHRA
jgi:hypothetical protein